MPTDNNTFFIGMMNQSHAGPYIHYNVSGTDIAAVAMTGSPDHGSTPVTQAMAREMYLTDTEVMAKAQDTTDHEHFTARPLNSVISDMLNLEASADYAVTSDPSTQQVYVLTTESGAYGAAALTRNDILRDLESKLGEIYILPSSIHEILVLPKSMPIPLQDLEQMVHDINRTEVREDEFLSDQVLMHNGRTLERAVEQTKDIHQQIQTAEERNF